MQECKIVKPVKFAKAVILVPYVIILSELIFSIYFQCGYRNESDSYHAVFIP